jgi:hypothetical protein
MKDLEIVITWDRETSDYSASFKSKVGKISWQILSRLLRQVEEDFLRQIDRDGYILSYKKPEGPVN